MPSQHVAPIACKPWTLSGLSDDLIVSHYENNYGGAVRALIDAFMRNVDWAAVPRRFSQPKASTSAAPSRPRCASGG